MHTTELSAIPTENSVNSDDHKMPPGLDSPGNNNRGVAPDPDMGRPNLGLKSTNDPATTPSELKGSVSVGIAASL